MKQYRCHVTTSATYSYLFSEETCLCDLPLEYFYRFITIGLQTRLDSPRSSRDHDIARINIIIDNFFPDVFDKIVTCSD